MTDDEMMIALECCVDALYQPSACDGCPYKEIENYENIVAEAKSEAIKEFAERLKEKSMTKYDWSEAIDVEDVDDLVKEMTEGKDNA